MPCFEEVMQNLWLTARKQMVRLTGKGLETLNAALTNIAVIQNDHFTTLTWHFFKHVADSKKVI